MGYMNPLPEDYDLLQKYVKERNLSKSTYTNYIHTIKLYYHLFQTTITQTIKTHKKEQKQGKIWQETKLYNNLITFRKHCYTTYKENMARKTVSHIKSLLRHNNITIYELPYWNPRQNKKPKPMKYRYLISPEELQKAYKRSNLVTKAIITFMISSGCDKNTTLKLTVKDFLKATYNYHGTMDIQTALTVLNNEINPVIPTWDLRRQKTNKDYTTFSTPESTKDILIYLSSRKNLSLDDPLFQVSPAHLTRTLRELNDSLGLGEYNDYGRLRCHMLRKYHASHLELNKKDEPLMTKDDIDYLQGRGKSSIHEAYFIENDDYLRGKYVEVMYRVTLFPKNSIDSQEYNDIKKENEKLRSEVLSEKQRLYDLQMQLNDLRNENDKTTELVRELLESQS